jgi:hypothetical protein
MVSKQVTKHIYLAVFILLPLIVAGVIVFVLMHGGAGMGAAGPCC